MDSKIALWALCYLISTCVLFIIGEWSVALMAAFILFVGLRFTGH